MGEEQDLQARDEAATAEAAGKTATVPAVLIVTPSVRIVSRPAAAGTWASASPCSSRQSVEEAVDALLAIGRPVPAVDEQHREPVLEQHAADRGDLRHDEIGLVKPATTPTGTPTARSVMVPTSARSESRLLRRSSGVCAAGLWRHAARLDLSGSPAVRRSRMCSATSGAHSLIGRPDGSVLRRPCQVQTHGSADAVRQVRMRPPPGGRAFRTHNSTTAGRIASTVCWIGNWRWQSSVTPAGLRSIDSRHFARLVHAMCVASSPSSCSTTLPKSAPARPPR